jgi:predicted phosphodiesterase
MDIRYERRLGLSAKFFLLVFFLNWNLSFCQEGEGFHFVVTSDFRQENVAFVNAMENMKRILPDSGAFMLSPGDVTGMSRNRELIDSVLSPEYNWYISVGNHDDEEEDREYLYSLYPDLEHVVNWGPENGLRTTYSFDYGNVHFVNIDVYYDGIIEFHSWKTNGVSDSLYAWLERDLRENNKPIIIVMGHEPAFPQPDEFFGDWRHDNGASLDENEENRDRFWDLLAEYDVAAYLCGHSHKYSRYQQDGVWQINAGVVELSAYTTFLDIQVLEDSVHFSAYRDLDRDLEYELRESWGWKKQGTTSIRFADEVKKSLEGNSYNAMGQYEERMKNSGRSLMLFGD